MERVTLIPALVGLRLLPGSEGSIRQSAGAACAAAHQTFGPRDPLSGGHGTSKMETVA